MKRARRTKIIATLGPASETQDMIARLFEAGADVFRLNMSHLSREHVQERVNMIRAVEVQFDRPISILADLQGPKLRLGSFADDFAIIKEDDIFILDSDPTPGDEKRVYLPHPEILSSVEPGHTLLIDDGKLRLVVESVEMNVVKTRVVVGGKISSRKGVSVPDTTIPVAAMTEKDRMDLDAALDAGVDWVALSFVQRPEDISEVKRIVQGRAMVLAKLEKPQAIARLDDIIMVSDALMVARGDLGVEMPLEKVPGIQKRIIAASRRLGKPVVVATQMLESMITSPVPTRAEVSDVATAVYDGADAIMLSAESAAGQYPVDAVVAMNRIATEIERDTLYWSLIATFKNKPEATTSDAIAAGAHQISDALGIKTIAAWSSSGSTVFRMARERSNATILALAPNVETARRLALVWGVHALSMEDPTDIGDMIFRACRATLKEGFSKIGDKVLVMAGIPFGTPGATNMVRIASITQDHSLHS